MASGVSFPPLRCVLSHVPPATVTEIVLFEHAVVLFRGRDRVRKGGGGGGKEKKKKARSTNVSCRPRPCFAFFFSASFYLLLLFFFFWTVGTHCFCFYHWNLLYSFYFWYCLSVMKATGVYICLVAMRFVCELDRVYEKKKKKTVLSLTFRCTRFHYFNTNATA